MLNEDLALDYDIGGLAVSATFLIDVLTFSVIIIQVSRSLHLKHVTSRVLMG